MATLEGNRGRYTPLHAFSGALHGRCTPPITRQVHRQIFTRWRCLGFRRNVPHAIQHESATMPVGHNQAPRRERDFSRHAPPEPGDEQVGQWPRSELEQMDLAFRQRLEAELSKRLSNKQTNNT